MVNPSGARTRRSGHIRLRTDPTDRRPTPPCPGPARPPRWRRMSVLLASCPTRHRTRQHVPMTYRGGRSPRTPRHFRMPCAAGCWLPARTRIRQPRRLPDIHPAPAPRTGERGPPAHSSRGTRGASAGQSQLYPYLVDRNDGRADCASLPLAVTMRRVLSLRSRGNPSCDRYLRRRRPVRSPLVGGILRRSTRGLGRSGTRPARLFGLRSCGKDRAPARLQPITARYPETG